VSLCVCEAKEKFEKKKENFPHHFSEIMVFSLACCLLAEAGWQTLSSVEEKCNVTNDDD